MRIVIAALTVMALAACSGSTSTDTTSGTGTTTGGSTSGGTTGGTTTGAPTSVIDARDGQTYPIVVIGAQSWLGANMNWIPDGGGASYCYANDTSSCDSKGRLYTYSVAKTVCPAGWHLASDDEWQTLETTLGMASNQLGINGENTQRGTDQGTLLQDASDGGFAAKAAGYGNGPAISDFYNPTEGYFWTSTADGSQIWRRHISTQAPYLFRFENPPATFAISVRCLQDSPN
jgi:uncharacterized protein (TIGR02145 family)